MKKILIIEDEKGMQEIYRDIFNDEKDKFTFEIVSSGEKGLDRVREKGYDLIILDIIMEPMTGDSFFVHMRSDFEMADLPVLVVSVISPELLERMKRIDHISFLQKPITKEQLFTEINRVLR
jgi:CheY-like chemotaxis protein